MPIDPNAPIKKRKRQKRYHRIELLLLVVLIFILFSVAARALKKITISQLSEITNSQIKAGSIDLSINGSVLIKDLIIHPKNQPCSNAILKAQTLYARFGLSSLLLMKPKLKKIKVDGFVFNAEEDIDNGLWNFGSLHISPPKGVAGELPYIRLKRGILQHTRLSNGKVEICSAIPIDAEFKPVEDKKDAYEFNITTAKKQQFGESRLTGYWKPGNVMITGSMSSADLPAFERVWTTGSLTAELNYDPNNNYRFKVRAKKIGFTHTHKPQTLSSDPTSFVRQFGGFTALQRFFNQFQPQGKIDLNLEANGNFRKMTESHIRGELICHNVSILQRNFPYKMEHIIGNINFTENSIALNHLKARHGEVKFDVNGFAADFGKNLKCDIRLKSGNMILDEDLYAAVDQQQKSMWSLFEPSGKTAIEYALKKDPNGQMTTLLTVDLIDVNAAYRGFSYPLSSLTGTMIFSDKSIEINNLISNPDERKIVINGAITKLSASMPEYNLLIEAKNIPLDDILINSLPKNQQHCYQQLELNGITDAVIKVFTPEDGSVPADFIANTVFRDCNVSVKKIGMNLSSVSGMTEITSDYIQIQNMTGKYSKGTVYIAGKVWPGTNINQLKYNIALNAKKVQLTSELFDLLPVKSKNIISKLHLAGDLNYKGYVKKDIDTEPDYKITIDFLGNDLNFESFPYPLKNITGSLTFSDERIELNDISANVADSVNFISTEPAINISGTVIMDKRSFQRGSFSLSANDIILDESLAAALPEGIRNYYSEFSPTGSFDLNLPEIKVNNDKNGDKNISLIGTIRLKNCGTARPQNISDMNALLTTDITYKTQGGLHTAQTHIHADKIRINNKLLTDLDSTIYYDSGQKLWSAKNFFATFYGGKLAGSFDVRKNEYWDYRFETLFDNVDLNLFLSDKADETNPKTVTTGRMQGLVDIYGSIDTDRRTGRCKISIKDMQAGKMSIIGKVLYVLKLSEPKDFAFENMHIDSYIRRDKIIFDRIDLYGKALSLSGSGSINIDSKQIDISLNATGKNLSSAEPSTIATLAGAISPALLRVDVTGSINEPQVKTTALPVLQESLSIIGISNK